MRHSEPRLAIQLDVDSGQTTFRCPECDACRWYGDLMLPDGLVVTCLCCGWSRSVKDINAAMKAGNL